MLGERRVVGSAGGVRIQPEGQLVLQRNSNGRGSGRRRGPGTGVALGEVGAWAAILYAMTRFDVLAFGQAEVFLGGDVAQHRGAGRARGGPIAR